MAKVFDCPTMSTPKTLLPIRHRNRDFFIADIFNASPRSDMNTMEHPFFSLSKKPDLETRTYEHNGSSISVVPSTLGMATVWDKDILIYCISQLVAGVNKGYEDLQPTLQVTAYDLLAATNRGTGGDNYRRLDLALARLAGTLIRTDLTTGGQRDRGGIHMVEKYTLTEPADGGSAVLTITLPDWLYRAAVGKEVLAINPDYFRLRGGIERRLYELARKHCGSQRKWSVGLELLQKKTGARSPAKQFRHEIKRIARADVMPDYRLVHDPEKEQLRIYNRKHKDSARQQMLDAMKDAGLA